jgi:hypothetical protein
MRLQATGVPSQAVAEEFRPKKGNYYPSPVGRQNPARDTMQFHSLTFPEKQIWRDPWPKARGEPH